MIFTSKEKKRENEKVLNHHSEEMINNDANTLCASCEYNLSLCC